MHFSLRSITALLLLAGGACASPEYRYVPTEGQAGVDRFRNEATFAIPLEDSAGNIRVTPLGIVDLKPKSDGDTIPALRVRLAISNQGEKPWTLRIQDQTVVFPNHPDSSKPIFASSESMLADEIAIPATSLRTIDLFYELPTGWREAKDLAEFDFRWKIAQEAATAQRSVSFARREIPTYVAGTSSPYWYGGYGPYAGMGWGFGWWGPSYAPGPSVNYRR